MRMSTEWAHQPLVDDATVRTNTGRGWEDWVAEIDGGQGADAGHTAIARWLVADLGVRPLAAVRLGAWRPSTSPGSRSTTAPRSPSSASAPTS
ncbi:hypothetical protein GCM10027426_19700 [Microbacterium lacusdiani]